MPPRELKLPLPPPPPKLPPPRPRGAPRPDISGEIFGIGYLITPYDMKIDCLGLHILVSAALQGTRNSTLVEQQSAVRTEMSRLSDSI